MERKVTKTAIITGVISLALLAAGLFITYRDWNFDDAYIVFRIVKNILAGHGWVYNVGQSHNPSTSVLNTLLITALTYLTGNILLSSHLMDTAAIFVAALAVYFIFRRHLPDTLALLTAFFLLFKLGTNRTWGIETNLFICMIFVFILFEDKRKNSWPIAALMALIRPDGILLAGFKWFKEFISRKSLSIKGLLTVAIILTPWAIFSLYKFGQIFPDTFAQKVWQGSSGYWGTGHVYLKGLWEHLCDLTVVDKILFAVAAVAILLVFYNRSALIYLVSFVICQQGAYILFNVPAYHWYYSVLDAAAYVLAAYAVSKLLVLVKNRWLGPLWPPGASAIRTGLADTLFLLTALVLCLYAAAYIRTDIENPKSNPKDSRDIYYTRLIKDIDAKYGPGDLATVETGTIGFYTDRTIIDITGLVSQRGQFMTADRMDAFYANPPEFILFHYPVWPHESAIDNDYRFGVFYETIMHFDDSFSTQLFQRRKGDLSELLRHVEEAYPAFELDSQFNLSDLMPLELGVAKLEFINGSIVTKLQPVFQLNSPLLHLEGWALDVRNKSAPPDVFILLVSPDSVVYSLRSERCPRPEIANFVKDRSIIMCGFEVKGLVTSLPAGLYRVLIIQKVRDNYYYSEMTNRIRIP